VTPDDHPVPGEGAVAGDTWTSGPSGPAPDTATPPWTTATAVSSERAALAGADRADRADRAEDAEGVEGGEGEERPRRRRGRVVALVLALVVLAGAAAGIVVLTTSGSTSSTPTVVAGPAAAERLVQASLAAAEAAGTFHYVSTSTTNGVAQTTVGDAAPDRGRQVITIGAHTFTVLVVGTTAYFQGDAATLQSELSLDPLVAAAHAGQWISLAPSDGPYQSVYAAVTTKSALDDTVTIAAKAVLSDTTIGGTSVTPVRGPLTPIDQTPITGTARFDVHSSRPHLPVRFSGSGSVNGQQAAVSVTFGHWGEPVTVDAPSGAVAYSTLQVGGLNPGSGGVILT